MYCTIFKLACQCDVVGAASRNRTHIRGVEDRCIIRYTIAALVSVKRTPAIYLRKLYATGITTEQRKSTFIIFIKLTKLTKLVCMCTFILYNVMQYLASVTSACTLESILSYLFTDALNTVSERL